MSGIAKTSENSMKKDKKMITPREISKADQDMIDELDYEYKKAHKPYDKWGRHWDEAWWNIAFWLNGIMK